MPQQYRAVASRPIVGWSYYRLVQQDFDGTQTTTEEVAIFFAPAQASVHAKARVYPNPSDGEYFNLFVEGLPQENEILVVVRDMMGREHYSKVIVTSSNGQLNTAIDPYDKLPKGTYIVTGSTNDRLFSQKLIVH